MAKEDSTSGPSVEDRLARIEQALAHELRAYDDRQAAESNEGAGPDAAPAAQAAEPADAESSAPA